MILDRSYMFRFVHTRGTVLRSHDARQSSASHAPPCAMGHGLPYRYSIHVHRSLQASWYMDHALRGTDVLLVMGYGLLTYAVQYGVQVALI